MVNGGENERLMTCRAVDVAGRERSLFRWALGRRDCVSRMRHVFHVLDGSGQSIGTIVAPLHGLCFGPGAPTLYLRDPHTNVGAIQP